MSDPIPETNPDAGQSAPAQAAPGPAVGPSPKTVSHARVAALAVACVAASAGLVMMAWSADEASFDDTVRVDPRIKAAEQDAVNVAYAATTYRDQSGTGLLPEPTKKQTVPDEVATVALADSNSVVLYEIHRGNNDTGVTTDVPGHLKVCVAHADGPWALYDTATSTITGSGVAGASCRVNR